MGTVTFTRVRNGVALLLGQIEGADISTAETNYTSAQTTSTLRGPDFPPTAILDSCVDAAVLIAQAICESDAHPELTTFRLLGSAQLTGTALPSVSSGSIPRIGPVRRVYDSSNSRELTRITLQRMSDFKSDTSAFGAYTPYFYAISGATLLHTRVQAVCEFAGFTRGTLTANLGGSDIIPLNDEHEAPIIWGATAMLAGKETMYSGLAQQCEAKFQNHLNQIRSYPDIATNVPGIPTGQMQ